MAQRTKLTQGGSWPRSRAAEKSDLSESQILARSDPRRIAALLSCVAPSTETAKTSTFVSRMTSASASRRMPLVQK